MPNRNSFASNLGDKKKVWEDVISDVVKCDTHFCHDNNLKLANKNLCELPLNLKLTDWNPKKLQSENVYLL